MYLIKQPITINGLEISSRLVMPPMATEKAGDSGEVSDALCAYYEKKAKGGHIGLIIMEHSCVAPEGRASKAQVGIYDDSAVEGLRRLTELVHRDGSKIFAQLNHAGAAAKRELTGLASVGASTRALPRNRGAAERAMDKSDILRVTEAFAKAAGRAKAAGFDGVEIHSAHGYLLNQFYSPLINDRCDEYTGASLDGRIRLHLEIISAVRAELGDDFPLALRLGACDYMDGGTSIADSVAAAREFERAGIDLLDISGGLNGYINPNSKEQGYFSEISEAIKARVNLPLILTGGVTTIEAAERLLVENKADMIGVGRTILYNSRWAAEAMSALI